jgi:hypothetical protein
MSEHTSDSNRVRTPGPYAATWRVYRIVGWITFVLVVGLAIGIFPLAALVRHRLGISLPVNGLFMFTFVVVGAAVVWESQWRCPRCGKRFRVRNRRGIRTSKCVHCGLPQWAERDTDDKLDTRKS